MLSPSCSRSWRRASREPPRRDPRRPGRPTRASSGTPAEPTARVGTSMQTTTVAAELTVARAPHEVFALFGTVEGAGWVFGARCDEVRAGAPVSLRLPLDE